MNTNRIVFPKTGHTTGVILDSSLSIAPLIRHLKQVIAYPKEHKNYLAQMVLEAFEKHIDKACLPTEEKEEALAPLFSLLYSFQNGYSDGFIQI